MTPVRIFRHVVCEGPGYLGTFLEARGIPYRLVCIDQGVEVPRDLDEVSGLVFMGGTMSVNDGLQWIVDEIDLIRRAVALDIPVMGICLGSQLISKALGAQVTRGPGMEIGWHPVTAFDHPGRDDWLQGLATPVDAFHWHGETFSIPDGAIPLLSSRCYENQAFAVGKTLGLQFHLEMTEQMLRQWLQLYRRDFAEPSACIQDPSTIAEDLPTRLERLHRVADHFFGRWLLGVA
jgi:GMP synthase-like glutamine amidotransferase